MNDRDRLIKDLRISKTEWLEKECDHETDKELVEYVADYLIADGWIRPPMKLGQMCFVPYYSAWRDEVRQYRVSSITQKADGSFKMRLTDLITKSVFEITPDEIGKTVFLTKDQAEQKLKEMRGDKNA